MSIDNVEKKSWRELPEEIEDILLGGRWGFSFSGGSTGQWTLRYINDDMSSIEYTLPIWFSDIMENQKRIGGNEVRRKINQALKMENI